MKKNTAIILIVLLLAIGAFATVSLQFFLKKSPTPANVDQKNIRIGFSLGDLREERWQKDRDLFVRMCK
jgi:D-xylose transport system substrate-binding protein